MTRQQITDPGNKPICGINQLVRIANNYQNEWLVEWEAMDNVS